MNPNDPKPASSNDQPEFDPLVVESADSAAPRPQRWNRGVVGAGFVAIVVVGLGAIGFALSRADGEPERATDRSLPTTEADSLPSETAPVTLAPVVTTHPFGWTVIDATDQVPVIPSDPATTGWAQWSLPAGGIEALDSPTEVVVLTANGVLHRIELPSGLVRSRSVPDVSSEGQIALAGDSVAVPQFSGVTVIDDGGSATTAVDRTIEVPRVMALGTLDRFLVAGGRVAPGEPERQWIVDPDGTAAELARGPFAAADPWDRQFLPSGELLVRAGGAVDAIDIDGSVRRVDDGDVVASGRNHYAIRQCEPECVYTVIDVATGERTDATLPVLDDYRFYDTAVGLSPDGRYVQVGDWRREQPRVVLVSVVDGEMANSWASSSIRTPDAWAPDSSGAFGNANESLAFYAVDGGVTVIEGLGPVRSVAVRPLG